LWNFLLIATFVTAMSWKFEILSMPVQTGFARQADRSRRRMQTAAFGPDRADCKQMTIRDGDGQPGKAGGTVRRR
jgi:hypothetical protein